MRGLGTAIGIGGAFLGLASLIGRPRGALGASRSPLQVVCRLKGDLADEVEIDGVSPDELYDQYRRRGGIYFEVMTKGAKTEKQRKRKFLEKCQWECTGPVKAARFENRKDPRKFAVLHPSTKPGPRWQVSLFDEQGPYGDRRGDACTKLTSEHLPPREWRLREVE